jgi:signal transduction histidine kinase
VVTPALALLLLHQEERAAGVVIGSSMVTYALILGAGIFVYIHWRLGAAQSGQARRLTAWFTVGLLTGALVGLAQVTTAEASQTPLPVHWAQLTQLAMLATFAVVALLAERIDPPGDPAVTGVAFGVVLTAAYSLASWLAPASAPALVDATLNGLVAVAGLSVAAIVMYRPTVSVWVRRRVALSAAALTVAHCALNLPSGHTVVSGLAIGANLVGAVALCTLAQALLRDSLAAQKAELDELHVALASVEAGSLENRELLHEVGSTVAGIASASRVIRDGHGLTPLRRRRLERMLDAELSRLQRMMGLRRSNDSGPFDVDGVLEPLVVSHQARGLDVRWTPTSLEARGDPDDLAEVVNILLDNAGRHAGPAGVDLDVRAEGDHVEVRCSDTGLGVAPHLVKRIFVSGARGPQSTGHGYGLAIARRLMTDRGGTLDLVDSDAPGATFVARLPRSEAVHAAPRYAAQ